MQDIHICSHIYGSAHNRIDLQVQCNMIRDVGA